MSACEIRAGIVRGRWGFDAYVHNWRKIRENETPGGKGMRTHDELAGVRKEQLANLETLWPEIGVESSRELVVAHGPLRCRSTKVIRGCLSDRVNV